MTKGIWTTDRTSGAGYNPGRVQLGDSEGHYTNSFSGTSSACPGIAGVAALVLARNPDLRWDQVKEILANSCDKIDSANADYDARGHCQLYGFGRVNALRAAELSQPPSPGYTAVHKAIQDVAISDQQTSQLVVNVGDTAPIRQLRVDINIEHTFRGDLVVRLLPPQGLGLDPITLHRRTGGGQQNLKRTFDSTSTPEFTSLVGAIPTGAWTLEVQDQATDDQGRITHFAVEIDL